MRAHTQTIIDAIDSSSMNRGLVGADWVADPLNFSHVEEDDVVLFDYEGRGIYQGHMLLVSRGRNAIECLKRAATALFDSRPDAFLIFGLVPVDRLEVKIMARWVGFKPVYNTVGKHLGLEAFGLSRNDWNKKAMKWDS